MKSLDLHTNHHRRYILKAQAEFAELEDPE